MSGRYAPVGAVVLNAYWLEHYTVLAHEDDGSVTIRWHGDARVSNPREARKGNHRTPLDPRDRIVSAPGDTGDIRERFSQSIADGSRALANRIGTEQEVAA